MTSDLYKVVKYRWLRESYDKLGIYHMLSSSRCKRNSEGRLILDPYSYRYDYNVKLKDVTNKYMKMRNHRHVSQILVFILLYGYENIDIGDYLNMRNDVYSDRNNVNYLCVLLLVLRSSIHVERSASAILYIYNYYRIKNIKLVTMSRFLTSLVSECGNGDIVYDIINIIDPHSKDQSGKSLFHIAIRSHYNIDHINYIADIFIKNNIPLLNFDKKGLSSMVYLSIGYESIEHIQYMEYIQDIEDIHDLNNCVIGRKDIVDLLINDYNKMFPNGLLSHSELIDNYNEMLIRRAIDKLEFTENLSDDEKTKIIVFINNSLSAY